MGAIEGMVQSLKDLGLSPRQVAEASGLRVDEVRAILAGKTLAEIEGVAPAPAEEPEPEIETSPPPAPPSVPASIAQPSARPASAPDGWTPAKVAELQRLWPEGESTSAIGRKLGMTKNAVLGKAHRLGLPSRPSPILPPLEAPPTKAEALRLPAAEATPAAAPAPEEASPPSSRHACQWIEGEPSVDDACKCGAPALAGRSYCPRHMARAYVPRSSLEERRKRRA